MERPHKIIKALRGSAILAVLGARRGTVEIGLGHSRNRGGLPETWPEISVDGLEGAAGL